MHLRSIIKLAAVSAGIAAVVLARRRDRRRAIDDIVKTPLEDDANFYEEIAIESIRDASDVQVAVDRERVDDRAALGATWLEVLREDLIESTPDTAPLALAEDDFEYPPSDGRDRPIADKGSGGRRGL